MNSANDITLLIECELLRLLVIEDLNNFILKL